MHATLNPDSVAGALEREALPRPSPAVLAPTLDLDIQGGGCVEGPV